MAGIHIRPEVTGTPCRACIEAKNLLMLAGGSEIMNLFNHIGKVIAMDSLDEALDKVSREINKQINQAAARFKIVQSIKVAQLKEEIEE